jgi:hypothetical protein
MAFEATINLIGEDHVRSKEFRQFAVAGARLQGPKPTNQFSSPTFNCDALTLCSSRSQILIDIWTNLGVGRRVNVIGDITDLAVTESIEALAPYWSLLAVTGLQIT